MDYKALFAAIKAEINARKLQYKQIADLAHLRNQTLHNWFATHPKPEGEKSSKGFIEIVKMLNLNLENFADVSSIGGRIEFLRWKNAMTVSELASKAGIDTTTICNYEANRLNIKTIKKNTVNKFATAFGVTADYILHGDKKEPKNGLVDFPKPTVQIEMEEVQAVEPETPVVENNEQRPLVPIILSKIGDQEVNSVSARDLYLDLGMSKAHWASWSKINIEQNEFFEASKDYAGFTSNVNGNETRDFAVTIEFAKHIAMMAKTKRAHDYRNYFIECEKVAKGEIQKFERGAEPIVISNLRENLNEAVEIMMILGLPKKQAATSALNIVKNSTGVDILALAGNPEI